MKRNSHFRSSYNTIDMCQIQLTIHLNANVFLLPIRVDNEFIADNYFHKKVPSTHGGGPYNRETSPLICSANQWTGFYMIRIMIKVLLCVNKLYFALDI